MDAVNPSWHLNSFDLYAVEILKIQLSTNLEMPSDFETFANFREAKMWKSVAYPRGRGGEKKISLKILSI